MPKLRRITALALAPAAALALWAGSVSAAAPVASPAPSTLSTAPARVLAPRADAVERVTAFFDQYKSAVEGTNPDMNPREVRDEFLTPDLNARLDDWADTHGADPVFRSQNVPSDRSVALGESDSSTTTVIVTEYWDSGDPTDVLYTVPTSGGKFLDLQDA